jgi:hypothetical protein
VVEAGRARLTTLDRVLLAGGVGVLAVGLAGLLFDVLRRLPKGAVPAREPA